MRRLILAATCGVLLASAAAVWPTAELIDRIVAVVDNQVILWTELNYRLRFELEQRGYADYVDPDRLNDLRRQVLDQMIDEHVLVLRSYVDSVEVDPSEVEETLSQQFRMLKSSMSDDEFAAMLGRVGLTERQLKTRYRREIRHRLLYRQMRAEQSYGVHVTRREVDSFRETYRDSLPPEISVSHINIQVRPSEEVLAAKRAKVGQIQERLAAGENFAALARELSEDPGTAQQGGDLGCFSPGQFMPEFEQAAAELRPGEVSAPVLTSLGYHLIKLHERREGELCASHILVMARSTEADRERARKKLVELRQQALDGADFSQLARENSDNRLTAMRGGLWDVFPRDQIPPILQPHLRSLELGDVSEPFFLDDGGHILKINDDQATIESLIREDRTTAAVEELINSYKTQIHIETRLDDEYLHRPDDDTAGQLPQERRSRQAAQ